jgi:uncharacterized membrane protein
MSELLLAVYESEDTAEHVLGVLRAQEEELTASLDSAAIVRLHGDHDFTVIRTEQRARKGQFWGVFWEALLGLTFRSPDPAPANNSNLGQLLGAIDRAGLDEGFRARVRHVLTSGRSALALVALNWNTESLIDHLYLRPDVLVRTVFSPQQELELLGELGRLPPAEDSANVRPCKT